ncbi:hypothetical protein [Enterococcus rivorum]|uniref:Uncharacterized protein n=1 Tax=Enterococcus rivorum TaxID=762845 RepID=A0A1E5KSB6_9ENTE|nr:hypothetical protein [Enterococcus rivorum]MBP2097434.1 hypothetical protein [Enterococcus rivorum]OEH80777.1 hypothetical protein BCR26_07185 [Enterococcus rivorum]
MNPFIIQLICGSTIVICSFFLVYYTYQLVLLDATNRGISHPKFWSAIASSSQNGSGFILYLFKRRNSSSLLSNSTKQKFLTLKRKIYCFMAIDLVAFLAFAAVLFFEV